MAEVSSRCGGESRFRGGDGVTWERRTAAGRGDGTRCSGCSSEEGEVGMASADGEGTQDHVKKNLGIERSQTTKEGGPGWLTASEYGDEL